MAVRDVFSKSYLRFSELWHLKSCREMTFKGCDPTCTLYSNGEHFQQNNWEVEKYLLLMSPNTEIKQE